MKTFFFGDHLISAGEIDSILVKTLFFGDHLPDFDRKTASISFKTDESLGQVRVLLFSASKKAPPPLRILGYAPDCNAFIKLYFSNFDHNAIAN